MIWAIDRFGRSMTANLGDILELDRVGVQVVSVRETWLDTGGPVRNLLIAIFSWVAEQERARLVERTKAGMAAARRSGARIGRPRARLDRDRLRELHRDGWSVRKIAETMGVGSSTVQRHLEGLACVREVA
jgi:DNA invertase Pin-like site-specific DNA recombinase